MRCGDPGECLFCFDKAFDMGFGLFLFEGGVCGRLPDGVWWCGDELWGCGGLDWRWSCWGSLVVGVDELG